MIHFGKSPNEDKIIIEVGEESLNDLHEVLLAAPVYMQYRILDQDGKELDLQEWPGHWCLQAVQLEEYCEDHGYDIVGARPNKNFTQISITVKQISNKHEQQGYNVL